MKIIGFITQSYFYFYPWRIESELKGNYESYYEKYCAVKDTVENNAMPYSMTFAETIDQALNDYMHNQPVNEDDINEDISCEDGEFIDENTANSCQGNSGEGNNNGNNNKANKKETPLSLKYKAEALKDTVSNEEYCVMMRSLNKETA